MDYIVISLVGTPSLSAQPSTNNKEEIPKEDDKKLWWILMNREDNNSTLRQVLYFILSQLGDNDVRVRNGAANSLLALTNRFKLNTQIYHHQLQTLLSASPTTAPVSNSEGNRNHGTNTVSNIKHSMRTQVNSILLTCFYHYTVFHCF